MTASTKSATEISGAARVHSMPYGAELLPNGGVRFRIWAPAHSRMKVELGGALLPIEMQAAGNGWHELETERAGVGTLYQFVLPDGLHVPDPASRFQPDDIHGPSEVIDPAAYSWQDNSWRGRAWEEAVVYELHIGAFTPEGTFLSAIAKLDHLVSLGVTALEIMPVADFPGKRNWGYDGVLLYAPDSAYGRPEDLKALVDAAHEKGLMVLLDVVYNHFGPDGNYLSLYAPQFFTSRHKTPWGDAINYDGGQSRAVRDFAIHNALYWLTEFHLDGLRLDAVHAIVDDSPKHLLVELADRVRSTVIDRPVHLVLENEENSAARLERHPGGLPKSFTAQWNDDVHHVLHTAATGEEAGYYGEYRGDTRKLGRALAEGFAFQGEVMEYRGSPRGEASSHLTPGAFVSFIQNHDQIGNRAFGDRLSALADPEALRAIAGVYLLLPQIPMLFMGEEWNAREPFPFFCDFSGELADAVRNGRREEFARFPEFQDPAKRSAIPDPLAPTTFHSAKLQWQDLGTPEKMEWLEFYRALLQIRRREIVPRIPRIVFEDKMSGSRYQVVSEGAVVVRWPMADGSMLTLAANLSPVPVAGFPQEFSAPFWQKGESISDGVLGPWSVRWSIEHDEASDRKPMCLVSSF